MKNSNFSPVTIQKCKKKHLQLIVFACIGPTEPAFLQVLFARLRKSDFLSAFPKSFRS